MANVLLVDPSDMARKVMRGVLARARHRLACVANVLEAWDLISQHVKVDAVVLELKLELESGFGLLERLRADAFFKTLPVIVYTSAGDRDAVKRALDLKVQNFLIKPYQDELILAEVGKALANPWRATLFEEENSFCKMMGYTPEYLHQMLANVQADLNALVPRLHGFLETKDISGAMAALARLASDAETAGAWGVVDYLNELRNRAEEGKWSAFLQGIEAAPIADRVLTAHLVPSFVPEPFLTEHERNEEAAAVARAHWFDAPRENRCPVVTREELEQQVAALPGFPIIDSIAASFRMSATGHPSSLAPLMDLTEKDPALSVQMLVAANRVRRSEDDDPIENPSLAIGLLGEIRLASLTAGFVTTDEHWMNLPPCSWPHFRMFQLGVARMARYTCAYLEMPSLEPRAYTAGLVHDVGKLLLLHLHPYGFQAIIEFAREQKLTHAEAERVFLGCTTRELAGQFALSHGLPRHLASVMRWADAPSAEREDAELVAIVALARHLCRLNKLGWSGEMVREETAPIESTPAWEILRHRVFPSFSVQKFEAQAHAECRALKLELAGRLNLPQL